MVREFHEVFGAHISSTPNMGTFELRGLRWELLSEETQEFYHAVGHSDIVETADALADIVYVAYGAAISFGIDLDAVLQEVHESNMSKLDEDGEPIYRADGKVLKGVNYFKPNILRVLKEQGYDGN